MTILSEQNGRVVEKKINDINDNSVRYKIIKLLHDKRDSIKDVCWASSRGTVRNGNVSHNDTTGIHYILKNILDESKLFHDVAAETKKGYTLFTVDGVKFISH